VSLGPTCGAYTSASADPITVAVQVPYLDLSGTYLRTSTVHVRVPLPSPQRYLFVYLAKPQRYHPEFRAELHSGTFSDTSSLDLFVAPLQVPG
jgi:hypothetical protein